MEDALAAGGVAVAVAGYGVVDGVVGDLGIEQGFRASLEAHGGIVVAGMGFEEGGEAYADDEGSVGRGGSHGERDEEGLMVGSSWNCSRRVDGYWLISSS